ncbi:MAG: hypothetical protein HYZ57_15490, partial [Acidobacteria bacterium]|nr:hypothetical protein [Acidobacteriota bacterium]MBI3281237.1 hypothetical protein [Acidobacteriota bacterium]
MERILSELVERLQKAHRDRLVSVVLYGSAAAEDGKDKLSDYNVLCVLRQITRLELSEAEPVFRWWREMKNPAPLLLSEEEVRTSTDCFPIEFTDIRERHRVLFGVDLVTDLEIDYSFYRARVEYELRSKLLRLRQKAGGLLSERDLLLRLMADSISTFCVLSRHVLLLGGHEAKFAKRAVIAALHEHLGIDPAPFLGLLDLREGRIKPRELAPAEVFDSYLKEIQAVVAAVDRLPK